ncbi:MAG: carbon-nitrogen hydrolase family protein [Clostridiales bacterium]|nr:carbon-nitrogen hydrolase family protein [Clostridiales bacterium]
MRLALCQLDVVEKKAINLLRAEQMLKDAAAYGADMAILPEMFSIKYNPKLFFIASEPLIGETYGMLSQTAKETNMAIIGGSMPEFHLGKVYNTSLVFDKFGEFIGRYRKAHLFDVDLPDFRFKESDAISAGDNLPLIFDEPIRTGVAICFDIRFPEWSRIMFEQAVDLIALPAAFSNTTGPKHWELLLRARAVDNQCFVCGVSPANSSSAYGHSMLCSPDGEVVVDLGKSEGIKVVNIDLNEVKAARSSIPVSKLRRTDLY